MKLLVLLSSLVLVSAEKSCKNKTAAANDTAKCYKGTLEIKANCMNYTVSVQSEIDPSLVSASWTDETTGKAYKNAFALSSRCSFPTTINQGDQFYFVIDSSAVQNCAVCMMYYPVPEKRLSIRVLQDPCPN